MITGTPLASSCLIWSWHGGKQTGLQIRKQSAPASSCARAIISGQEGRASRWERLRDTKGIGYPPPTSSLSLRGL